MTIKDILKGVKEEEKEKESTQSKVSRTNVLKSIMDGSYSEPKETITPQKVFNGLKNPNENKDEKYLSSFISPEKKIGTSSQTSPVKKTSKIEEIKTEGFFDKVGSFIEKIATSVGNYYSEQDRKRDETQFKSPTYQIMYGDARLTTDSKTGKKKITSPSLEAYKNAETEEEKLKIIKEAQDKTPAMQFLKSEVGKKITGTMAEATSNIPLKAIASIKAIGDDTYDEAYSALMKKRNDPNNNQFERIMYGLQDSGIQSALGALLGVAVSIATKNPSAGRAVSMSYFAPISVEEERQSKDGDISLGNVLIDTVGDTIIGGISESVLKTFMKEGAEQTLKSFLAQVSKGFLVEGTTEPSQTFLKFANDYKNSHTEEEKQQVVNDLKEYVKNGGMIDEFLIGGLSGAGITAVSAGAGYISKGGGDIDVEPSLIPSPPSTPPPPPPPYNPPAPPTDSDFEIKGQLNSDFTTIRDEAVELTNEVESNPDNVEVIERLAVVNDQLRDYETAVKNRPVYISSESQEAPLATIETVKYPDGKVAVKISANAENQGMTLDFPQSKLYSSEEEAVIEAKESLISWANESLKSATTVKEIDFLNTIIEETQDFEKIKQETAKKIEEQEVETKREEPLVQEAKKYDSAEEFVNAQLRNGGRFNISQETNVKIENGGISFWRNDSEMKPEKIGTLSDLTPATRKEFIDAKNALEKSKGTGMENTKPAGERYFKAKNTVDKELFAEEIKTKSQLTDIWNKAQEKPTTKKQAPTIKKPTTKKKVKEEVPIEIKKTPVETKEETEHKQLFLSEMKDMSKEELLEIAQYNGVYTKSSMSKRDILLQLSLHEKVLSPTVTPITQKEKVAKAIKEKPKTIKQISEETNILEPNVRRILGVGAKEGTFERVEKGVYVLSKDGQDIAWVETGNAVESLPKLAKEGFKADMVFLDIPYDTPAVRGGNRGVKYNLVSVEDFAKVLDAVSEIAKNSNTPVIHMYSQAESGLRAMAKYNDLFIEKGFKPVGKGQYQKTFANGDPVTSPNGKVSRPEGILVFTQSGELNKDLKDLNFTLKRPKGYQTEKPAEMLKAMIEMTTEEGDMVLDPFAGSGVTGAEAIRAGRKAYLIETDPEVAEKITKPRVKEATEELKFDEGAWEWDKSRLKKAGIGVEAMGFDEHATVLKINGVPALGYSMLNGALSGFSVAEQFRGKGIATNFIKDLLKDSGGKLDIEDANKDMISVLKKIGDVSEPDGAGTVTLTQKKEVKEKKHVLPSTKKKAKTLSSTEIASKIIKKNKNPSLPILQEFKVANGKMFTTDLEIFVELNTDLKNGMYKIVGKDSIKTETDSSEFPITPDREGVKVAKIDTSILQEELKKSNLVKSKNQVKPELTSVFVDIKDGKINLWSTDSFRLYYKKGVGKGLVDAEFMLGSTDKLEKVISSVGDTVEITNGTDFVTFSGTNGKVTVRKITGQIPDLKEVIPSYKKRITFNKEELISTLKELKPYLPYDKSISLSEVNDGKITLTAENKSENIKKEITIRAKQDSVSTPSKTTNNGTIVMPIRGVEQSTFDLTYLLDATNSIEGDTVYFFKSSDINLPTFMSEEKDIGSESEPETFKKKQEGEINSFIDNTQVLEELKNYFNDGELEINFVKQVLMPDKGEAWAKYFYNNERQKGVMEFVLDPVPSHTPSHEAVHGFLSLFVSPEQKLRYTEEAVQRKERKYGKDLVKRGIDQLWTQNKGKYSKERIRQLYGEEILANNFIDHITGKNTKSFLAKLFDNIIYFIKRLSDSKSASRLYDDILTKKRDFVRKTAEAQTSYNRKEGAKSLNAQNIIGMDPIINLKRDVIVTDVYGNKSTIPSGEALTPYLMKGSKFLLKDGQEYVISKNQYQNVKANSVTGTVKEFAPELEGTEETVLGIKKETKGLGEREKAKKYLNEEGIIIEEDMTGDVLLVKNEEYLDYDEDLTDKQRKAYDVYIGEAQTFEEIDKIENDTKFEKYTLPNGENYKEILIQAPKAPAIKLEWTEEKNGDYNSSYGGKNFTITPEGKKFYVYQKDGQLGQTADSLEKAKQIAENYAIKKIKTGFQSAHWSEPNVISHIRLNERPASTDSYSPLSTKKVTFLEEIQSDWAREARAKQSYGLWQAVEPETGNVDAEWTNLEDAQAFISRHPELELKTVEEKKFPTSPLLKNWQELSIKRALVEAVNNNSDYLAWTTGEQQSARYNLSKEVDKIEWGTSVIGGEKMFRIETKQGTVISGQIDNNGVIIKSTGADWKGKNIAEAIGKGIGEKIANEKQGELKGEGLNIGGTWAFNLYDKQIKNIVEDLTGGKVEMIDMGLPVDNKVPAFDLIQPSGERISKLAPDNLEVGAPVSNANGDYYIITDILGEGKFKAVPKSSVESPYSDWKEMIKLNPQLENLKETFDISQKTTLQPALKLTPEIKAIIRGEAPALKQPSGEEVFMPKEPEGLGMIEKVNPIEMPELVKLARELTGESPRIRAKMRNKLGYFRGNGEGEIYLKADQFVRGNEVQVAQTLAHEIGHLVDFIPDKTLKRGNLLGRIYSLRKFMGSTFNKEVAEKLDLDKIRNEAFKEILAQEGVKYSEFVTKMSTRERLKPLIKLRYGEKIDETGSIRNEVIKDELTKVTEAWRPYDKESSSPAYLKYRKKPQEIYADAISMLFNSPETLKEMAPTFYTEFFDALDRKPLFKAEYFELMKLLGGSTEEIFKARKEDIRKGFTKAEELQSEFAEEKKLAKTNFWQTMRQQVDDINYPITKKQQEAEAKGKIFAEEESPRFLLQEESYTDNDNFLLVDDIDKNIVKPLEETGMIIDDLGEYLMLDRIQKDRADIANPFGFNVKNAAEQMEFLKQSVGESNFNLLKEKAKYFHDLVFKSVEEAVKVGSYNAELFETKIKPNKDSYASFQVVDYMQDYMPATIKAQVGTLKEVANPFISTILKTIALNRLNAHQRSKTATVKMLQENFPEDITETRRITSDGKLSIFKPAKDRGSIELLEDGKMQSYDVDPYIAESFKHSKSGDMFAVVSLIDKFNNKLFKPIVTTYNLGFAAAFNPIRDFKRNYKAIPNASVLNLLTAYVKSLPSAVRYSKGEMDAFTRSLVESKAINAPINDYNYDPREDELGRILERYGLVKSYQPMTNKVVEGVRKTILRPVAMVLEGMRFTANTFEIISKVAGARVRMAGGEEGKQLAYNLRNFTGTPNWKVKGKITNTTNALFVFSNIMKEGIKSDLIIATDPKTRSGYWFKTVKMDLLPKLLMFMASAGLLGELLKGFFDDVSEYDKTNYLIVPLGRNNGKTVYVRIPHDETGRLVSSTFWKMANFVKEGGHAKDLQDIVAIGAGQLPSLSPVIEIGGNWLQYSMGKNPYDSFRGRNIIDDTTFAAGGSESLKKMVEWTTNSMGLTRFATFDTSKNTGLETFMQVAPWFSNVVKISNYGQQEQLKEISTKIKSEEAQQILKDREVIAKYVKIAREDKSTLFAATKYRKDLITEALGGHLPKTQEEIKYAETLMTKFKRSLKRGLNEDPRVDAIISSTSSKQKVEILKTIQADMTEKEFSEFKNGLLQDQIVTAELLFQLRNK